jgi:hypothetical protein
MQDLSLSLLSLSPAFFHHPRKHCRSVSHCPSPVPSPFSSFSFLGGRQSRDSPEISYSLFSFPGRLKPYLLAPSISLAPTPSRPLSLFNFAHSPTLPISSTLFTSLSPARTPAPPDSRATFPVVATSLRRRGFAWPSLTSPLAGAALR